MGSFRKLFAVTLFGLLAALGFEGCSSKPTTAPPIGNESAGGTASDGSGGGRSAAGGTSSKDGGADASLDATIDAPITNCGSLLCQGHSHCVGSGSAAVCACDNGYVATLPDGGPSLNETANSLCVVDTSCINLRYLQNDSCRFETNGAPAVGLFFAVDYCAGTAVLPADLAALGGGDPSKAFRILENNTQVVNSLEASATIIPHSVESYITLVIDMSASMTADVNSVAGVLGQIRTVLLPGLRAGGQPPIGGVSILTFARNVEEYLPFTRDLDTVDLALQDLQNNPQAVTDQLGKNGTSVNKAFENGIRATERMQGLRDAVTKGGVLTTGTVVMITDASDNTGYALNTNLISTTKVNLLSVGIGTEVDFTDLSTMGRDGTFLAQSASDWAGAFQDITTRVQNYPKRTYLLGYCSSATTGTPTVSIEMAGSVKTKQTATCTFNADLFGAVGSPDCNPQFFTDNCNNRECGGLTACGACADSQCCANDHCQAPSEVYTPDAGTGVSCAGQDELCLASGKICQGSECTSPAPIGGTCSDVRCDPTKAYCNVGTTCSAPPYAVGDQCAAASGVPVASLCAEQNCAKLDPANSTEAFTCQPQARAFDFCSGSASSAVCETGTACQIPLNSANQQDLTVCSDNQTCCIPRHTIGCNSNLDCASGKCVSGVCYETGACYFDWNDKIDRPFTPQRD